MAITAAPSIVRAGASGAGWRKKPGRKLASLMSAGRFEAIAVTPSKCDTAARAWDRVGLHTEVGLFSLRQQLLYTVQHLERHARIIEAKRETLS